MSAKATSTQMHSADGNVTPCIMIEAGSKGGGHCMCQPCAPWPASRRVCACAERTTAVRTAGPGKDDSPFAQGVTSGGDVSHWKICHGTRMIRISSWYVYVVGDA